MTDTNSQTGPNPTGPVTDDQDKNAAAAKRPDQDGMGKPAEQRQDPATGGEGAAGTGGSGGFGT